jgi:hypothetical protein
MPELPVRRLTPPLRLLSKGLAWVVMTPCRPFPEVISGSRFCRGASLTRYAIERHLALIKAPH